MGLLDHAASHLQDVKSLGILEEVCPTAAMISRSTAYCLGIAGGCHLQQNATLITSDVQGRLAKRCVMEQQMYMCQTCSRWLCTVRVNSLCILGCCTETTRAL